MVEERTERLFIESIVRRERAIESSAEWNGEIGPIHALVERDLAARLKDFDIYLAGPPPLVQACLAMLSRHEVAADRVHYDAY